MKAKDITFGGIMVALGVVVLYLSTVLPFNTFAIFTLASCLIPFTIVKSNLKTAIFVYIATSIIAFFILPINYSIIYALFFGIYGILKYFIEKIHKLPIEIILKLAFFNIVFFVAYTLLSSLIVDLNIKLSIWMFIIIAEAAFLIYDYALTLAISIFIEKFKRL